MTPPEWERDDHSDHDCQAWVESALESQADHLREQQEPPPRAWMPDGVTFFGALT